MTYKNILLMAGCALDAPTTIHPVEQLLSPENNSVQFDVPPYSLNIIRLTAPAKP